MVTKSHPDCPDEASGEYSGFIFLSCTIEPHTGTATLKTIFPRLCGTPPSISCAARACSHGSTAPTRAVNLPRLNKSVILSNRAVVTSTRKNMARMPLDCCHSRIRPDTPYTTKPPRLVHPNEHSSRPPP